MSKCYVVMAHFAYYDESGDWPLQVFIDYFDAEKYVKELNDTIDSLNTNKNQPELIASLKEKFICIDDLAHTFIDFEEVDIE